MAPCQTRGELMRTEPRRTAQQRPSVFGQGEGGVTQLSAGGCFGATDAEVGGGAYPRPRGIHTFCVWDTHGTRPAGPSDTRGGRGAGAEGGGVRCGLKENGFIGSGEGLQGNEGTGAAVGLQMRNDVRCTRALGIQ
eukprot:CAMPEP_0174385212 /NCGR_PEP_ID=MMETSP0811_2-20130205/126449_1 /TAXON_ID=73025 ORGANISM="Eutreptiella gymnastica-like, Strain CCMP1594" /NCGR_SAMPLE_ID=MMETSP0811_2 /ASSEMBLY_ACC=CAM_ASM_000667 /LENGTH=135 /DNA_ID=CAMNT_0015539451 /DNA_START=737 /DNA_END=1144 /DNA_ORIENTATION=-